jgi:uncharacterized protein YkwD
MKAYRSSTSKLTTLTMTLVALFAFAGCSGESMPSAPKTPPTKVDATHTTPDQESQAANASEAPVVSNVSNALKSKYLDAINAARAEVQDCGAEGVFDSAPALVWNDRLGNAAYEHSFDMALSDTFSHTGSGTDSDMTAQSNEAKHGSTFRERIEHNGYVDYHTIGENIAAGFETPKEVVNAWLKSSHHCANLMNPDFSEVGMAFIEKADTKYTQYWSQEFGGK